MCTVHLLRSRTCPHLWLTVQTPCKPTQNFTNCPTLMNGVVRVIDRNCASGALYFWAPPDSCPWCDKNGDYDSKTTRVVVERRYGVRVGMGELRKGGKGGVDVVCCGVM